MQSPTDMSPAVGVMTRIERPLLVNVVQRSSRSCVSRWLARLHVRTFKRGEEVEEGIVGHLFCNSAHSATSFMLLLLLNGFHRHVFALVPVYLTAVGSVYMFREEHILKLNFIIRTRTPEVTEIKLSPFTVDYLRPLK